MCGICGLIWRKPAEENRVRGKAIISSMLKSMRHRGPDGEGCFADEQVAIGHVRLKIIDLESGAQPMQSKNGDICLSYNGEVYGYQDRMAKQKKRGWEFVTTSDTETLLAGYLQDGCDFDFELNGMYAYALLDRRKQANYVQLAVDPVGIKPLYMAETEVGVLFSSELKGIVSGLNALGLPFSIDENAVASYLILGWVPAPSSMLRSVQKLEPGSRYRINLRDAKVQRLKFRYLPDAVDKSPDIKATLEEVMKRQVVSDAPLGFFLSGGIDSSLLVSVANKIGIRPRTFTVRFTGEGHGVAASDESNIARLVANHCAAEHHELAVSESTLIEELEHAFIAMDQPISDPACLPLLVMSRYASQSVKVCISGDGGDELFLGYPRHRLARYKKLWQGMPSSFKQMITDLASILPTTPSTGMNEKLRKLRVALDLLCAQEYFAGPFSGKHLSMLEKIVPLPSWSYNVVPSDETFFEADMLGQLSGQLLPKTDHITMYTGLETRVPFLDLEMIRAARSIPLHEKIIGGKGKIPLRGALSQYLPDEITQRPKQGFRVPLTSWFNNALADEVRQRLMDPQEPAAGLITHDKLDLMLKQHVAGNNEHSIRIWALLALQSWVDRITSK